MGFAVLLLAQFVLVVFFSPVLVFLNLATTFILAVLNRKTWRLHQIVLALLIGALPLLFLPKYQTGPLPEVTQEDVGDLMALLEFDNQFDNEDVDHFFEAFEAPLSQQFDQDLTSKLEHWEHPEYLSFTLLNLKYDPIGWTGMGFADEYRTLAENRLHFIMRDGRFMAVKLIALPSPEAVRGYAVLEVFLLSTHATERPHTWISHKYPAFNRYLPVVVQPSVESDFLYRMTRMLDLEVYPFEINFVLEPQYDSLGDRVAVVWAFLLMFALWVVRRQVPLGKLWPFLLVALGLLALPLPVHLDHLSSFGSYIFGTIDVGNLLASPTHFFLTVHLVYFLLQSFALRYLKQKLAWTYIYFVLALMAIAYLPPYLQTQSVFSFIHPLEAISSPGALLTYLAFLYCFGYVVLLMTETQSLPLRQKLAFALGCLVLLMFLRPDHMIAGISLTLIWFLKKIAAPFYMRAALTVFLFYPFLVITEHRSELEFVHDQLLDEIALMVERNYFRMGRIINQSNELPMQLAEGEHPHLMEMFAKQCGLLSDEIDFALQLSDPSGVVISSIEQHVSLEQVRYYDAQRNKIELDQGTGPSQRRWMIYRTSLPSARGEYELVAVLGNDYQNLSLVRRPRRLDQSRLQGNDRLPAPYFAYILDVFDLSGNPIYSQGKPNHLRREDMDRLEEEPYFWYAVGRNTLFLFADQHNIYRITHKATPLHMIFVRWLTLFLVMIILINSARWAQHSGRSLMALWKRSFTLKMAGFMFLTSVLPTSTLGYLLVQSIQKNQASEEEALARSKILAAKNLLTGLRFGEGVQEEELDPNLEPFLTGQFERINPYRLPIAKFSQILGEDLSLFYSGTLVKTNQPEIYRLGLLMRRLSPELAKDLMVDRRTYTLERRDLPSNASLLVTYSLFPIGPEREAVLAMTMIPFSQRQVLRWQEQLEFSLSILFGLLFLMAWITRYLSKSFLRPVSAITRAASRMAKNRRNRPIVIHRQDELQQMVEAFNAMRERIQESQSQLEDQLGTLDETLKSMSSGLLGLNATGTILLENERAWELLNLDQKLPDLSVLLEQRPGLKPLQAFMKYSEAPDFAFNLQATSIAQDVQVKVRKVASQKLQKIRYLVILEDITDALAASRFKAWSEMARRVAHEIKNPLTPIRLEIDHLNRLYQDGHPEFSKALADTTEEIKTQVEHLKATATEFADYARPIQSEPEPVDLPRMIDSLMSPYRKTLENISLEFDLPESLVVSVDPKLLRRAMHNLVTNAFQAMSHSGILKMAIKRTDCEVVIVIEDNGPGIPPEARNRIFEAYFSTKDHGTGLGLVIAKKYVDLQGGTLRIDPTCTTGTRFLISLPARLIIED